VLRWRQAGGSGAARREPRSERQPQGLSAQGRLGWAQARGERKLGACGSVRTAAVRGTERRGLAVAQVSGARAGWRPGERAGSGWSEGV
jgi:hypothetical protein